MGRTYDAIDEPPVARHRGTRLAARPVRPAQGGRLAEPGLPEPTVLAGTYTGSSRLTQHATH